MMWFSISSAFFLTQLALLDFVSFASVQANMSKRSTPPPLTSPSTVFPSLEFWSGESMKARRVNDCTDKTAKNTSKTKKLEEKSGRRREQVYNPRSIEERKRSTRFALADIEHTSHKPESEENETITTTDQNINAYTLQSDMAKFMAKLDANTSISVLAKTIEVHDIVLCKISERWRGRFFRALDDKYVDEKPEKKIIIIVHGLTPMGFREVPCLYYYKGFQKLLDIYTRHINKFDIFLIPMGNPDGIGDQSLKTWNKNKSPQNACFGVCVDRNFDVGWNKTQTSHSCSQQYPGPYPFSEPESRAVADLIHHYNHKIVAYIHVHAGSYDSNSFKGDAVLYPKGYKDVHADDKYTEIHSSIEEAMRNAGFRVYSLTVTSLCRWYGQVSGTSVDYVTEIYGIPYGLEFVMQSYKDSGLTTTTSEEMQDNVLSEVWRRVIDVIFNNIYQSTTKYSSAEN